MYYISFMKMQKSKKLPAPNNNQTNLEPWPTLTMNDLKQQINQIPTHRQQIVQRFLKTTKNPRQQFSKPLPKKDPTRQPKKQINLEQYTKIKANQRKQILTKIQKNKTEPISIYDPEEQHQISEKLWRKYDRQHKSCVKTKIIDLNEKFSFNSPKKKSKEKRSLKRSSLDRRITYSEAIAQKKQIRSIRDEKEKSKSVKFTRSGRVFTQTFGALGIDFSSLLQRKSSTLLNTISQENKFFRTSIRPKSSIIH